MARQQADLRRNFAPKFRPELTPRQMLELGVFGGRYMTDCRAEFPASWFRRAKLCPERHDPKLNCFAPTTAAGSDGAVSECDAVRLS